MTMLVSIDLLSGKFMSGAYLKLNILKVEKNINSIKHWLKTDILCLQSELKSSKNQTQLICFPLMTIEGLGSISLTGG